MREDKRNQLDEKFTEELLDASLNNYHGAEPLAGLEERVLANLRRQSRAARLFSWKLTSAMIAAVAVLILFAADHLIYHQVAPRPAFVAVSEANNLRGDGDSNPTSLQRKAGENRAIGVRAAKQSRRQNLALNLNTRRENERPSISLQIEEVRIAVISLDDIILSSNDR